jgi:o-succinylbenzoate synthase
MNAQFTRHELIFKQASGTSRGVLTTKETYLLEISEGDKKGIGECAIFRGLSYDDVPDYEEKLTWLCENIHLDFEVLKKELLHYPSIIFGLEQALLNLKYGSDIYFPSDFTNGKDSIKINGLIWMGNFDEMYSRIEEKMKLGFRCIKVKIGAIDFNKELELLEHIRQHFSPEQIELRVDANGAFSPADAPFKLESLHAFHIHSIEQPIRAGQWKEMATLCQQSPFPIALDEELIGINTIARKIELLETIRPQYIILKPSLHGGIQGATEWIKLAKERGIGSWVTSALESNIGLNAIAQWCATLSPDIPQGLGTGMLFTDNIDYPLHIQGDCLWFHPEEKEPDFNKFLL